MKEKNKTIGVLIVEAALLISAATMIYLAIRRLLMSWIERAYAGPLIGNYWTEPFIPILHLGLVISIVAISSHLNKKNKDELLWFIRCFVIWAAGFMITMWLITLPLTHLDVTSQYSFKFDIIDILALNCYIPTISVIVYSTTSFFTTMASIKDVVKRRWSNSIHRIAVGIVEKRK